MQRGSGKLKILDETRTEICGKWTDYWVSQGRKFCEFCKCSIADNKPSIQFHENGKKHKENVAKRLTEMQKKASKEAKDALNFDKELKKIEAAALKAYAKDVSSQGDYTSNLIRSGVESLPTLPASELETKLNGAKNVSETTRKWREAISDDGRRYYWNFETGESVWEPPKEGFLPLGDKRKEKTAGTCHRKPKKGKFREKHKIIGNKECVDPKGKSGGKQEIRSPSPVPFYRGHPYGTWKKVDAEENKSVDLQLPHQEFIPIAIPKLTDEREKKFKEKIFKPEPSSSPSEQIVFKKRKNMSDQRKNMRQRLDDD